MSKYDDMIEKSCFSMVIYSSFPAFLPNITRDQTLHQLFLSSNYIYPFILHIFLPSSKHSVSMVKWVYECLCEGESIDLPTLTLSRITNGPATPDTVRYSAR